MALGPSGALFESAAESARVGRFEGSSAGGFSAEGPASRTVPSALVPAVAVGGPRTCFRPGAGPAGAARAQVGPLPVYVGRAKHTGGGLYLCVIVAGSGCCCIGGSCAAFAGACVRCRRRETR